MAILELKNVKKYFGERLLFYIEDIKIHEGERIGLVGINGSGKTTLMNIIANDESIDQGEVVCREKYSYITQLKDEENYTNQGYFKFGGDTEFKDFLSGGEKLRFKISKALSENTTLLLADEPTTNLDIEGIGRLEKELNNFKGTIIVISHDRQFLDNICSRILEIEDGSIKDYSGNFSYYIEQKAAMQKRMKFEYEQYISEKKRLTEAIVDTKEKSKAVRKAPRRMGNSEARLCKMGDQKAKKNLDSKVKAIKSRLDRLQVKENPKEATKPIFDVNMRTPIYSKIVIEGKNINLSYGHKELIRQGNFKIKRNRILGFIGNNGTGKTSLINAIMKAYDDPNSNHHAEITMSKAARIGYFAQDLSILNENKTLLQNIMDSSIYEENTVRTLLRRMVFSREDFNKKVEVLSGGERVKASLCKIFTSDFNMLILDEPTNYLDIYSLEALEDTLKSLDITLVIVSHDRRFLGNICNELLIIEDKTLKEFHGTYEEYLNYNIVKKSEKVNGKINNDEEMLVLSNKLSQLISIISLEASKGNHDKVRELDEEYQHILKTIKSLS